MKLLLLLVFIGIGVVGYIRPPQQEETATNCAALVKRMRAMADVELAKISIADSPQARAAMAEARARLPTAAIIEAAVHDRLPFLPPEVGCAAAYWYTIFQPDLRTVAPNLFAPRPGN